MSSAATVKIPLKGDRESLPFILNQCYRDLPTFEARVFADLKAYAADRTKGYINWKLFHVVPCEGGILIREDRDAMKAAGY